MWACQEIATRKRICEDPPESPAKVSKVDKSPSISVTIRDVESTTTKKGVRRSTVKDVQQKKLIVATPRPKVLNKRATGSPPPLASYRRLLQVILNLTSRDFPLQEQVDDLIREVGPTINPICRQLLEAFERDDADAQHFAIFSLGYSMCKDKYLEQANKDLKDEISGTHRKLSSINEALQEIKPYIENNFRQASEIKKLDLKEGHEKNIKRLQEQVSSLLVTHDNPRRENEVMSPATRTKYKKYFGSLFPSLEKEYNDGGDPESLFSKHKKIRREQRSNV